MENCAYFWPVAFVSCLVSLYLLTASMMGFMNDMAVLDVFSMQLSCTQLIWVQKVIVYHQVASSSVNTNLSCRLNNSICKPHMGRKIVRFYWCWVIISTPTILFEILDRAVWQQECVLSETMSKRCSNLWLKYELLWWGASKWYRI